MFMLMDPFGNFPIFISPLSHTTHECFLKIVLRESAIALCLMVLFLTGGRFLMKLLDLTGDILRISGGLILLLIGIKMIFFSYLPENKSISGEEPLIVPLAVPLICGPGIVAILVTS